MANIGRVMDGLKPAFVMVVVQILTAGVNIFYKLVSNDGLSASVFIAQRSLIATSFIVPLAFFMERKSKPKITSRVLAQAFLCGLFGSSLSQNLLGQAVALATASYVTAVFNLVPGATFILAVCFRLERLNIGTSIGKAKVFGVLLGIGGAMILTFYKSIEIHTWSMHVTVMRHIQPQNKPTGQSLGSIMAFGGCLSHSTWLIVQARMGEKFPWHYTSAALMSLMGSIQSILFAVCMERDWSQWKLGLWNIRFFAVLYTGILGSAVNWVLINWCVRIKGPLYASIFMPLFLVFVAIAGFLLLDERLYLGSIIGSLLIVFALYIVLWVKHKELKSIARQKLTKDSVEGEPLEIITTNHADDKSKNDSSDMKSPITTPYSFLTVNDHRSREGKEQNVVKDVSRKGKEEDEGKEFTLNITDSKPSA